MKTPMRIALFAAAATLALVGCRQPAQPGDSNPVSDLVAGASASDGAVTASLVDGAAITGDDGLPYVGSGPGHFEVKSNAGWTNITNETASVVAAGADKMLKLDLGLTGGTAEAPKQFEVTYAFDEVPSLKAAVWTTKIYIPAVYATPGLTAYPSLSLYVKTGPGWTGYKVAEASTFALGSGWKTLAVDFEAGTFTVNGQSLASATTDFSAVDAHFGQAPGVTLAFYAAALDPAMTGAFYVDYLDVTGVGLAQVAAPTIEVDGATVTLASATTGATIHYTTDGTDPTTDSPVYTDPVTITATTTFKALAVKTGMAASAITETEAVYVEGDTTGDPEGTTFAFASNIAAAEFNDWGASYGSIAWGLESASGADGVLILQGETTAPTAVRKTVVTLSLPAPVATLTSVTLRLRVPASLAGDWWQALTVAARTGDAWTWNASSEVKFPAEAFVADAWKTVTLPASAFSSAPTDVRALTLQVYRDFAADTSKATSLGNIEIDWVSVN